MVSEKEKNKNLCQLKGSFARNGYDWWWHSFTAVSEKNGKEKAFFIEYFIINPEISPDKVVLGSDGKPCYFMIDCGTWKEDKAQLHQYYPMDEVRIDKKNLHITGPSFLLTEDRIQGHVEVKNPSEIELSDSGFMEWDIKLDKVIGYDVGYGTSALFRNLHAFDMYWHAKGVKTLMDGYVIYNGERYLVKRDSCYGYSDKNWGRDFTSPWIWLSSSDLVSEKTGKRLMNSCFEIGGGKPRAFHITFKDRLLILFFLEGKRYEFNFSKFWLHSKTEFDCYETEEKIVWNIVASRPTLRMETHIECQKKDMLLINYEAPDGERKFHRLFNGGSGVGRIRLFENGNVVDSFKTGHVGCEYGRYHKEGDDYRKQ